MIIKMNGTYLAEAAAPPILSTDNSAFHVAMEAGGDKLAEWVLTSLGTVCKDIGIWFLQISPDLSMLIGMILCLGAIMSLPKMGKWTSISVAIGIVMEIIRRGVLGP